MKLASLIPALFVILFSCSVSGTVPPDVPYPDSREKPDGWAGSPGSPDNPGGAGAPESRIYTVTTKKELLYALKCGTSSPSTLSKIIYIDGMIDLLDGHDCDYYVANTPGLSQTYGSYGNYRTLFAASCTDGAAAALAPDRDKLYAAQKGEMIVEIPSNTTLLGVGNAAGFSGGQLSLSGVTNVVIRNLTIENACDYFPSWYQSSENNFNSEFDNLLVSTSTWVWIDHCTFSDGQASSYYKVDTVNHANLDWVTYDGLIDVVRGSDYVTISWNRIENHDKTMLFGNSDSSAQDRGKLNITVHHNYFSGVKQRLPRVRFGKVHIYNNLYENIGGYAIGVGDNSRIYSEKNIFYSRATSIKAMDDTSNEGYIWDEGSLNADSSKLDTPALVGWNPSDIYPYAIDDVNVLITLIQAGAGVGNY